MFLTGRMRPSRALWAYLIYVFAGGAIMAPWIYRLLLAAGVEGVPFRRVLDRCLLILALLGLWKFVQALGVRTLPEIGLRRYPEMRRDLLRGLALGSILLGAAAGLAGIAGAIQIDPSRTASAWIKQVLSAAATAGIVALLEEVLFRGAIFTALRRAWNDPAALWVSSALYAILHFFARPENPPVVQWDSGFIVLGRMLSGFTEMETVMPGFLSLTLLGMILALAFKRTGALFLSMGIHAALIFWLKLYAFATNPAAAVNVRYWGTEKIIDGFFCFVLLLVTAVWFAQNSGQKGRRLFETDSNPI